LSTSQYGSREKRAPEQEQPLDSLSKREVLALIAEGLSNAGVAQELVITTSAVERHVSSILDKLGLYQSPEQHRRVLAVLNYLRS
jgi:DNA-binding NarL/FixJ family response regulator